MSQEAETLTLKPVQILSPEDSFGYALRADAKRKAGDVKGAEEDVAKGKALRRAVTAKSFSSSPHTSVDSSLFPEMPFQCNYTGRVAKAAKLRA